MGKDMRKIEILNELIEICKDSRSGFWQAAFEVENKSHRELLRKEALERNAFAFDLQNNALKLGIKPTTDGTLMGAFHRAWMGLRHHLNPHHDEVVLLECKRGEEHALHVYEEVLEKNVLPEIQPVLEKQFVSMIESRDELGALTSTKGTKPDSMLRLL
jgi:uncharacterized protein (TIGR02284 family)